MGLLIVMGKSGLKHTIITLNKNFMAILAQILQKKDDKVTILKKIPLQKKSYEYEKGWYDISSLDKKIKCVFYPGKEVYQYLLDKDGKETVDKNLSFIVSLIKETGKETSTIYKEELKEKNVFYRSDGSILYNIESKAYERIWEMSLLTGNEEMGIITDKSVLVVPNYKNSSGEGPSIFIPGLGGGWGDLGFAANHTPNKPVFVLQNDGKGTVSVLQSASANGRLTQGFNQYTKQDGLPGINITSIQKEASLRSFAKQYSGYLCAFYGK